MKKYVHFNETEKNTQIIAKITDALKATPDEELKQVTKKSVYLSERIRHHLQEINNEHKLETEAPFIDGRGDKIDIAIISNAVKIIIEIDNMRADQVVKKIFSRTSALAKGGLVYITVCYDKSVRRGDREECKKYLETHCKNYFDIITSVEYLAFVP